MDSTPTLCLDVITTIAKRLTPSRAMKLALTCKQLYEIVSLQLYRRMVFDEPIREYDIVTPFEDVIMEGDVALLSWIYDIVASTTNSERTWAWYMKNYGHRLFNTAATNDIKCYKFLLGTLLTDASLIEERKSLGKNWNKLNPEDQYRPYLETIHTVNPWKLFVYAVGGGEVENVGAILDSRYDLLDNDVIDSDRVIPLVRGCWHPSAKMIEYLVDRGIKLPRNLLYSLCEEMSDWGDVEFPGKLDVLVCKGIDVDGAYEETNYETPLFKCCKDGNPQSIITLLKKGANPNGIGCIEAKPKHRLEDHLTRPIDILIENCPRWFDNWRKFGAKMRLAIGGLIEQDASLSWAPFGGDPVQKLIHYIWRHLCMAARELSGIGPDRKATVDELLDILQCDHPSKDVSKDISDYIELCDMMVSRSPKYSAIMGGLKGKECLFALINHFRDSGFRFRPRYKWTIWELHYFSRLSGEFSDDGWSEDWSDADDYGYDDWEEEIEENVGEGAKEDNKESVQGVEEDVNEQVEEDAEEEVEEEAEQYIEEKCPEEYIEEDDAWHYSRWERHDEILIDVRWYLFYLHGNGW
ncbi:uncharacterized protein F4822DRAFT_442680 [Hypoxylon trugodes]|uniref:uncharacterized protein n=1 Tax=Hypoxylon trugodes TaxID=326681 RepID=UPI0021934355|nr:uncharacterized protein F4822DRAFT_442680 [Hypoxylon trugodes]KAI1389321.1 hypothetical protein F4822DRAFT_442680 [Hypoxylon trugodes]